ncbi:uncharacterized protein LOC120636856 [Pararge aegeria]|nr:uncharacterized protein LOC120636856 [Pararge aegeria]
MAFRASNATKSSNVASVNVKHVDPENRKRPPVKAPSKDLPFLAKSAAEGPLEELATTANQLFQEAKTQLEQSGNIKATIKETLIECLSGLYTIALRLNDKAPCPVVQTAPVADFAKEVLEEIRKQSDLVVAARTDMGAVRETVEKLNDDINKNTLGGISYAAMAATTKSAKTSFSQPERVHSLIVSSVDAHDTSDDVIVKIRTAVSAKISGLRVDRLRKVRDQKVVLGCQTQEELAKVADKLRSGNPTLLIEEKANKDPLIIIKNVLSYNTDEDITGALKNQNAHLLAGIPEGNYRAVVRYRRKARNPLECHAVLQVSPSVWQNLTQAGKVHVDLQRVQVEDQSPLIQCTRCLSYGHGRKLCTEAADQCSHCTGPHLRRDCPHWMAGEKATCRNCQAAKLDKLDHDTFDKECPIRKKWDRLARLSVAYC